MSLPPILDSVRAVGFLDLRSPVIVTNTSSLATAKQLGLGPAYVGDCHPRMLEDATLLVGIGSGRVMDRARAVGDLYSLPVLLIPTILSTDAAFSPVIAERNGEAVTYRDATPAVAIVLDEAVLTQFPWDRHLLALGDLLAIESATRDYARHQTTGDHVAEARALLDRVLDRGEALRHPSMASLVFLAECMREKITIGLRAGHACLEEGTEHYLAYFWEASGGKPTFHGNLLWAGLAASAVLQKWPEERLGLYRGIAGALPRVFRPVGLPPGASGQPNAWLGGVEQYCRRNRYLNTVLVDDLKSEILGRAAASWMAGKFS